MVGPPAAAGEPPQEPVVNVADHASAGVIDRAAIRRALAAIPSTGGVLHIPAGRHRVSLAAGEPGSPTAPPRVADLPSRVEVRGYGAILELVGSLPTGSCMFRAERAEDLVIRGLTLAGPGGGPSGASGISLFGCTGVQLRDVTVASLPALGIRLGVDATARPCRDITIESCSMLDCASGCIVLVGTEQVAISGCTLGVGAAAGPRPGYGVGLSSTPYANRSVVVGSSHVEGCGVGIDCIGSGTYDLAVLASTVAGNGIGARLRGDGVTVVASSFHRNQGTAISASGSRIRLEANSVNHGGGGVAVSGTDVLVRANLVYNCGAGLAAAPGATVAHNLVNGTPV
jgi:hypothetical protein